MSAMAGKVETRLENFRFRQEAQPCRDVVFKPLEGGTMLYGDDLLYPEDCKWSESVNKGVPEYGIAEIPEWVAKGEKSPTGRHTFTTWKHWTKEDALLPSGLLGPVVLRFGKEAKMSKTNGKTR